MTAVMVHRHSVIIMSSVMDMEDAFSVLRRTRFILVNEGLMKIPRSKKYLK